MSPLPGGGVQLQHLGDGRQVGPYVGALALPDLQRGERGDRVAERGRIDLRTEAADHPVRLKPVQPGLHGAAGHPEPAGRLQHADPRLAASSTMQPAVQPSIPMRASREVVTLYR